MELDEQKRLSVEENELKRNSVEEKFFFLVNYLNLEVVSGCRKVLEQGAPASPRPDCPVVCAVLSPRLSPALTLTVTQHDYPAHGPSVFPPVPATSLFSSPAQQHAVRSWMRLTGLLHTGTFFSLSLPVSLTVLEFRPFLL